MVSIVIPVLNEENCIEDKLKALIGLKGEKEIIVVDGGSTDRTVEIAEGYAEVIRCGKGRARQMNAGGFAAKGSIIWFLHIDSAVPEDSLREIEKAIEEGYIGGSFRLYFYDSDTVFMRYVAVTSNIRVKLLKLVFGDQGIFMKKEIFEKLKGYKDMELMEDWELSVRIHKLGKMKAVNRGIGTSARRFKKGGQLRTLLHMHNIKLLYILGTPTEKLSKMYGQVKE